VVKEKEKEEDVVAAESRSLVAVAAGSWHTREDRNIVR
jgi:hypothetical protein